MARVGVKPNAIMSKAVYLRDLDDVIYNSTQAAIIPYVTIANQNQNQDQSQIQHSNNKCRQTFTSLLTAGDPDAPAHTAGLGYSDTPTRHTATRLRRTRQHLAGYRHDLLVAMRLVNNVERETIKAEWENWVLDEGARCRKMRDVLEEEEGGEVKREVEAYCADCLGEVAMLGKSLGV